MLHWPLPPGCVSAEPVRLQQSHNYVIRRDDIVHAIATAAKQLGYPALHPSELWSTARLHVSLCEHLLCGRNTTTGWSTASGNWTALVLDYWFSGSSLSCFLRASWASPTSWHTSVVLLRKTYCYNTGITCCLKTLKSFRCWSAFATVRTSQSGRHWSLIHNLNNYENRCGK